MACSLGVVLPVVQLTQRFKPPQWEIDGHPRDLARIARAADRAGYDFIACPEHVGIPVDIAAWRGGRYYDPAATLSYLAAHTSGVRLLTHTVVLGYHHPLALVKRYATLDVLSEGRLILGVGIGSLEPEFDLLGANFRERGAAGDDAIRAIRAGFASPTPSYAGTHYSYSGFLMEPNAVQKRVPIWVGGRTFLSLKRALTLGDGWVPFALDAAALKALINRAKKSAIWQERSQPFDMVLAPEAMFDPLGDPAGCRKIFEQYAAIGATSISVRFSHASLDHYCDQLERLAEIAGLAQRPAQS